MLSLTEESFNRLPKEIIFNEPWMDNLDSSLLYRYWLAKDTDKLLVTKSAGVKLVYKKYSCCGILQYLVQPLFKTQPASHIGSVPLETDHNLSG